MIGVGRELLKPGCPSQEGTCPVTMVFVGGEIHDKRSRKRFGLNDSKVFVLVIIPKNVKKFKIVRRVRCQVEVPV